MRKAGLFVLVAVILCSFSGCSAVKGFGAGLARDTKGLWQSIIKADEWFKENCW